MSPSKKTPAKKTPTKKATPKPPLRRPDLWDDDGLLEKLEYEFDDFGLIDWKAMVLQRNDLLIPNRGWFFRNKGEGNIPRTVDEIEDPKEEQLALSLKATHWLLNARGYKSVSYEPVYRSRDMDTDTAVYKCTIVFKGNFETGGDNITYEAIASATESNTLLGIPRDYLDTIAQNRALSRAVRGFLNVNIVSDEEFGEVKPSVETEEKGESKHIPLTTALEKLWGEKSDSSDFEEFVEFAKENGITVSANSWEKMEGKDVRECIGLLKSV